ncbi:MAG: hypothetical protein ACI4KG_03580 [Oscillospiraceae bacterium]
MKKESVKTNENAFEQLVIKLSLSICVNIFLVVGVCFLLYETGFSTGKKLMLLYAAIAASYIAAIVLHTIIFVNNPLKKYRWLYILITLIGMFPHIWSVILTWLDLINFI